MSPAAWSLVALLIVIVVSCTSRINVGLLAIAAAWIIGVYAAGWKPDQVFAGFPSSLWLTLTGVTLLFGLAQANGTLALVAQQAVRIARGSARVLPILFFLLALIVSSIGPGAIASVALIVPLAMAIGAPAGVPPFLTALMVANGANAGNLSPISAVGVIVNTLMAQAGIAGHAGKVWLASFVAHALVSSIAYLVLSPRAATSNSASVPPAASEPVPHPAANSRHWLTLTMIAAWVVGVAVFKVNLGLAAFAAAAVLVLARAADEREALRILPWSVILMVSGVTVLIAVLEKTGGLDLFTTLLARLATPNSVNGVIAFVTGIISTYSSTSGVVLPAFLPTVPGLVEKLGGGDPLAVALSINVGSALVDVSPLSTLGALCVAAVQDADESHQLFRRLLIWGLSMTIVGAVLCQLLIGPLARL
jgi:di/tricarboxylate transporter